MHTHELSAGCLLHSTTFKIFFKKKEKNDLRSLSLQPLATHAKCGGECTHVFTTTHALYSNSPTHTLLTSSPSGLVKRQFAMCRIRAAVASQVTNWQHYFTLPLIVGARVFTTATESPSERLGSVLEQDREGNDGNSIHVCFSSLPFPSLLCRSLLSLAHWLILHSSASLYSLSAGGSRSTLLIYYTPLRLSAHLHFHSASTARGFFFVCV